MHRATFYEELSEYSRSLTMFLRILSHAFLNDLRTYKPIKQEGRS